MVASAKIVREIRHAKNRLLGENAEKKNIDKLCNEWRNILSHGADNLESAKTPKKILFVTGSLGTNPNALSIESFLIKSLQLRGHDCVSLLCDGGLPSCEFNIYGPGNAPDEQFTYALTKSAKGAACKNCGNFSQRVMDSINCPVQTLSDHVNAGEVENLWESVKSVPPDEIRSMEYKNVKVGDHAFSSTLRITLKGSVDFSDRYEVWVYRKQLLSSILMVDRLNRVIDLIKPEKMVCIHGVYLSHGTAVDVCNLRGIDVVVYGAPYRKNTLFFSHGETYHRSLISEESGHWRNLQLDLEMEKQLDSYLDSKTAGGRDHVNYHPNPIVEQDRVMELLDIDQTIPVVTLFTNVIWDAQIYYNKNAFKDIFDWLYTSIEYFEKRSDIQLIIRVHPAESKGGFTTKQPIEPEIRTRFPSLPKNVRIVSAHSDVSSYTLVDISKAALIYGTKMGLEIAIRGVPVIVAGETFCRNKGFTYDVDSRQQYLDCLDKMLDLPLNDQRMIQDARKFAYYYFFMRMLDMPLLNLQLENTEKMNSYYSFSDIADILPGRDENLDVICNGIVEGYQFYKS